jgi:hypothetical protein
MMIMKSNDKDDPKFLLIGITTRIPAVSCCNNMTPVLAKRSML